MQESRRWCWLEQRLLPLSLAGMLVACAAAPSAPRAAVTAPEVPLGTEQAPAAAQPSQPAGSDSGPLEASASLIPREEAKPTPPEPSPSELPKGTRVLHIGDSFAASLGVPLGKRLKAAGVRYILEFETASYVPTWAFGDALPKYIGKYSPDLVIITLGANEIEIPNPEQRAGAVKRLIKHLGGRPCVWVGPPLWKPDSGFINVIRENSVPCRFLDSTAMLGDLPRKRDKIHPNDEGRELWADAVMSWLGREREPAGERPWSLRRTP